MHKHMLIAGSLVLSGCLTTAEIPAPARPSATAAETITGGEASARDVPSDAQLAGNSNVGEGIQPHSESRKYSRKETVEAETARINAWINEACPRFVGPASWSRCVERERSAVNAGLPSTEGLPADIRAWIDEACPRFVGPASWSRCVERERSAVNAGLPSTEGLPADIRAWIDEACPRFVGPASWSRCIRRELNAVNARVPSGGRSSTGGTQTAPANTAGEDTIEWGETPAATRAESGATNERVAESSTQPPKDPAPHLPKPKNGERWLCGHSMSPWVLDVIKDGGMETPESTIVLTRESPRDQARGTGKIAVAGVTHDTHFEIVGINRRWDWNFDNEAGGALDTFIIRSDGEGAYYDFRGVEGANTSTGPREFLQCVEG